jgi:hypothetical protein
MGERMKKFLVGLIIGWLTVGVVLASRPMGGTFGYFADKFEEITAILKQIEINTRK